MTRSLRLIPARDFRRTPWKNGGGETREIAAFPAGASLDAFDWRVSMAHVGSDGPFSRFPDIDRTLAVLSGEGIVLDIEGRGAVSLDRATPPYGFPGDVAVAGRLIAGPIDDLNVMTRRGRVRHLLLRVALDAPRTIKREGEIMLAIVIGAAATARAASEAVATADGDALMIGSGDVEFSPAAPALLYIVNLWRMGAAVGA